MNLIAKRLACSFSLFAFVNCKESYEIFSCEQMDKSFEVRCEVIDSRVEVISAKSK
jgi:hypothetical protein